MKARTTFWVYCSACRILVLGGTLRCIHPMICLHAPIFSLTDYLSLRFIIFSFDPYLTIHHSYLHASLFLSPVVLLSLTLPSYLTHVVHFHLSSAPLTHHLVSNATRFTHSCPRLGVYLFHFTSFLFTLPCFTSIQLYLFRRYQGFCMYLSPFESSGSLLSSSTSSS
jgi:hypothetical protein